MWARATSSAQDGRVARPHTSTGVLEGWERRGDALILLAYLLGFSRDLEIHATVVVGFQGGGEIEVGKQDLVGATIAEVEERPADDGVTLHFRLMAILEDQDSGRR